MLGHKEMEEKAKVKKYPALPPSDTELEKKQDPYEFHHRVETCPCGICSTARYHAATWNSSK